MARRRGSTSRRSAPRKLDKLAKLDKPRTPVVRGFFVCSSCPHLPMTGGSCVIDDEDPRPQSTASALAHRGASATLAVFLLLKVMRDVAGSRCELDGAVRGPCFGPRTLWDEVALQGNDNLCRGQVFPRSMRSGRLDADNDGIPCESVCGKSDATMAARMNAQPFAAPSADGSALGLTSNAAPAEAEFQCGSKRTCRQMNSCAEATFHFESCGVQSLDGNGDGIACNGLCN